LSSFLTVTQAAAKLGISSRRLRAMIAEGTVKATKVNDRLYLINERDLKGVKVYGKRGRPPAS
jgi:excisionase family DNA binding protein